MGARGGRVLSPLWSAVVILLAAILLAGVIPGKALAKNPEETSLGVSESDPAAQDEAYEVTINYYYMSDDVEGRTAHRQVSVYPGETVTISANELSLYVFDGWYEDDVLLSTENPWTFQAERDMVVRARYKRLITHAEKIVEFGGGFTGEGEGWAYTGEPITPKVTVTDEYLGSFQEGVDFTVTYEDNVYPGRAYAIVTGIGDCTGVSRVSFEIWGDLSRATIAPIADQVYPGNGAKATPAPTVTFGGKTLTADTDYKVSYEDNDGPGTATVTVTGVHNNGNGYAYYGSASRTFKIVGKEPTWSGASKLPVAATADISVTNGGWIRLKSGGKWVKSDKVLSLSAPSTTTKRITAKAPGTTTLYLLDSNGKQVASKRITVYAISSGTWEMQSAVDASYVLDIRGKSKASSARMIVYQRNNGKNQRFQFEKMGDGTYLIKCVHSGKYVDVQGGGTEKGQPVIQYTRNAKDNQRWKITVDAWNRVTFVSKKSGMCFDIKGGKVKNGAAMIQWPSNNGKNQKWVLNRG